MLRGETHRKRSILNRGSGQRKIFAGIEKLPRGPRAGGVAVSWREG